MKEPKAISFIPIPNYVLLKAWNEKISIKGRQWWRIGAALLDSGEIAIVLSDGYEVKLLTNHNRNAMEFDNFMYEHEVDFNAIV